MSADERLDAVRVLIESGLRAANEELDKFAKSFADDPAHAMDWSASAFNAAAVKRVTTRVLEAIGNMINKGTSRGDILSHLVDYSTKEILTRAKYPKKSTSATSNLLDAEMLAAWADISDILRSY
jgi:hypothetical protein